MSEPSTPNGEFERLLEYLRQNRGFDFTGYKRPSLMRRVIGRMQAVNIEGFPEYLDYLEVHPERIHRSFQYDSDQRYELFSRRADVEILGGSCLAADR